MSNAKFVTRVALVGAGAMLMANTAMAGAPTIKGCQAALNGIAGKYQTSVAKAIAACADNTQKLIDGGDPVDADAALKCDGKFDKAAAARGKASMKCTTSTKCDSSTLHQLGHLVSTENAPGTGLNDFVCNWMLERAETLATQQVYAYNPRASAEVSAAATVSTGSTAAFFNNTPEESTHACVLTGSNASVVTGLGTIPVAVTGILQFDIGANNNSPDFILISGAFNKGLAPVSLLGNNVCVTTAGAEGVCDCAAAAPTWNSNMTLCRDSDTTDSEECLAGVVLDSSAGTTANGPLFAVYSGASSTGTCSGVLATGFKIVAPADVGPDLTACTPDDLAAPLPALAVPFSTGTANGISSMRTMSMVRPRDLDSRQVHAAASCTALKASTLSGLKLAAAAPTMDGDLTGDAVFAFVLNCS